MAKKKRRRRTSKKMNTILKYEITGIALVALCLIIIVNGDKLSPLNSPFYFLLGEWHIVGPLTILIIAVYMIVKRELPPIFGQRLVGIYLFIACFLLLSHIKFFDLKMENEKIKGFSIMRNTYNDFFQIMKGKTSTKELGGGMIGALLTTATYFIFGSIGTKILSFFLMLISLILITGKSIGEVLGTVAKWIGKLIKTQWQVFKTDLKEWKEERKEKKVKQKLEASKKTQEQMPSPQILTSIDEQENIAEPIISSFTERAYSEDDAASEVIVEEAHKEDEVELAAPIVFTEHENKDYKLPPLSLLSRPGITDQSSEYKMIHDNTTKLNKTFQSFGVKARVTQVHLGPAVTKYEIHPEAGVKVSRIVSLSDDIALALAAKGIRIEAPIPGKSAIGIEVPNTEVAVVSLREVLESKEHDNPEAKLQIGLGRDITGQAVVAELNRMPHLLVAGATGSGKSVCVNGIITSILMRAKPHEVKMMMIDPKMVELNVYNGIPHLLAPVVTDPKKASQALKKVVSEMERRYELFSHSGTRNIEGYNEHMRRYNLESEEIRPLLPYIVVIVDELADLMMVASNDVEDSITRLAQMARAAGIHLIIATQRPSVDVITGVIKANIPSRIAFAVSSSTDSRTILDSGGAEKLLGRGDMLFLPVGASKPVRVQGAFLSDDEVENVVDFVIAQQKAHYQEEMIPEDIPEVTSEVEDELYEEAVQLIAEMQTASVSMLQRRFRIGYTRAARLIDEMEARGVVGPYEGSKPRAVLVPKPAEEHTS
ncbi:DNA translocase FtsK [Lederbergia wuyishanensis]|uniref:S-DNA-T family DNA segregation ATPase FtsK/SpoIIIE n=1 Tax=Lederbergia wuyishanensis TaxID=1347903 RepID=A0ABU0CZW5_9BACI|nr:DNA translocase FtsK [Lederbergia wuyishanensis]MCJ8006325.1 DNA translocase FtsK [Lederbergia wuyishanensis]MDQ0341694.1 S-DNA-T family DNA segregation ATPase FtsK/SpoIIIE [Lederbergia wuyishanensis]